MVDCTQDLFSAGLSVEESRILAAKTILMAAGYRVSLSQVTNSAVNSKRKLRDYFYMRLDAKHPNRQRIRIPNIKFDMQIVARFVEARMDGLSEQSAIQECVAIIDALFDHEEEFGFKYPVADIGILGQGKMGWITAKAISIVNRKRDAALEREALKKVEAIENAYEVDAKEVSNNLDDLLKRMEDDNGEG